jgi:hypothetical protein
MARRAITTIMIMVDFFILFIFRPHLRFLSDRERGGGEGSY